MAVEQAHLRSSPPDRTLDADVEIIRTILDGTTRALISYMLAESDRSPDDIASAIARLLAAVLHGGPGGSSPAKRSGADQAAAGPRAKRSAEGGPLRDPSD